MATTLLDSELYPGADVAALYRARWHAELDLRSLKVTLAMDVLRGKSPKIVRKETWAHLLAYNLIRSVMAQAAVEHGGRVLPVEWSRHPSVTSQDSAGSSSSDVQNLQWIKKRLGRAAPAGGDASRHRSHLQEAVLEEPSQESPRPRNSLRGNLAIPVVGLPGSSRQHPWRIDQQRMGSPSSRPDDPERITS